MEASIDNMFVSPYLHFFFYKKPSWWWWYACHLTIYIDRPIYIWQMEIKLKDTRTSLHTCRQGLPSFILISNNLIVEQLRKEASGTNWPGGCCRRRQSPCLRSVRPPTTTTPHSSSPYLIFLEISLVFTHGITPARFNHNKCFIKKCILIFRAMHGSC